MLAQNAKEVKRVAKVDYWRSEDGLISIEGWAREGLSNEQLADKMGINAGTLYRWKDKYSEICEAIKKGKAPVDFKVENQLLKSALGYYVTVKKPVKLRMKKQEKGVTLEKEIIEYTDEEIYIPPNPAAIFFWLKNRKPDKWRDKQEVQSNLSVEDLTPLADMINDDTETTDNQLEASIEET